MSQHVTTNFERLDGTGLTTEYRTGGGHSMALAYLDMTYGTAKVDVQCFDPYKSNSRTYTNRTMENALGIITRHLAATGYPHLVG